MGRVMSVIGVPMLLGPVLGPVLGGLIVDNVSLALDLLRQPPGRRGRARARARILPTRRGADARPRLDVAGLLLLSPGAGAARLRAGRGRRRTAASARPTRARRPRRRRGPARRASSCTRLRDERAADRPAAVRRRGVRGRVGDDVRRSAPRCSARCCCCRSTTRSSAASPRSTPACCWPRRASARRWRCRSRAGITDRVGAGRIVPVGLSLALLGTLAVHAADAATRATGCWPARCSSAASAWA